MDTVLKHDPEQCPLKDMIWSNEYYTVPIIKVVVVVKNINVRLFGDSELAVVGVNDCLFLCAGPVMDH